MTTQEIKKYILLNFLSKKGKIKYSTLTLENLEENHYGFFAEMKKCTLFLDTNNMTERLYNMFHTLSKINKCACCDNKAIFKSFKIGYSSTCSGKVFHKTFRP